MGDVNMWMKSKHQREKDYCKIYGAEHANVQPHSQVLRPIRLFTMALLQPWGCCAGDGSGCRWAFDSWTSFELIQERFMSFVAYGVDSGN